MDGGSPVLERVGVTAGCAGVTAAELYERVDQERQRGRRLGPCPAVVGRFPDREPWARALRSEAGKQPAPGCQQRHELAFVDSKRAAVKRGEGCGRLVGGE